MATPRLRLQISTCPAGAPSASEIERSLRTELEADALVELVEQSADTSLVVEVGCDAALRTSLRLRSTQGQHQSERTIVLADANPSARAGIVALAAAELVRADLSKSTSEQSSRTDLSKSTSDQSSRADYPNDAVTPPPTPASAPPPPASSKPRAPSEPPAPASLPNPQLDRSPHTPPRAFRIAADARLRWFVDSASVSWGGAVGADVGSWRLRAETLLSAPHDALGTASLGSAAMQLGYRVLDQRLGALRVTGYPVLAAGATWMRGSAALSTVHVAPTTGFYADARWVTEARLEMATLALELGRSTGYVARSEGRTLGATGGFFIGANAGGSF